ncbi:GCN5-related N-acetyltransferase [Paenibacillus curdlanolyticus YK9]|uniref:GCN5-related N-acetyltransferase n=1 Tax=Paenibacillus curdlanolyticus YK9 TaxID=717606 RepID=E0I7X7_9BACL|nr:GNAT family N-acetyltransferase [Paenibacillus curdlanolyticus]EFM11282.1 GCN5-related N-acetyltransferase [Paenibacillus curdlanolyticus YK9]
MSQPNGIIVRDAASSESDIVRQVMLGAYEQYAPFIPESMWEPYRAAISASVEGDGPSDRLVALWDGEIVGAAQVFDGSESAYGRAELAIFGPIIRYVSVLPKARGRGIATALLKETAARSLARGYNVLHLHTSDMMASAVKLYERLGFERAYDKEFNNGEHLVKSYRLYLPKSALLFGGGESSIRQEAL